MKVGRIGLFIWFLVGCRVEGHFVAPDNTNDALALGSWVKHVGGGGMESVDAVAIAPDGGVFVAGSFEQTIDLGGGPLVAAGWDLFVAKFGADGQHIWSKRFGNGSSQAGSARLRLLTNGDLVIAGAYRGSLTLGATTLNAVGESDVFIVRMSNVGEPIWARSGGTANFDGVQDLSVDPNDNIALCGQFTGTGSFFGGPDLSNANVWLARVTAAGDHSWSRAMAAGGIDNYCGVASMSDGDVVFAGNFNGTVNAGGGTFTSTSGTKDMYVVRYAGTDGSHRWSMAKGGAGQETAYDVEPSGSSIVVTGSFSSSISFGGSTLTAKAGDDVFVAKFDGGNGSHQFSVAMGGMSQDGGRRLAVRSDGVVTVAGQFAGTADFGGMSLTGSPVSDHFVVDLDASSGAALSVRSVTGTRISDIASSSESLVMGGTFGVPITILGQQFTSTGTWDGYLVLFKR
jgi:hypothetical protein